MASRYGPATRFCSTSRRVASTARPVSRIVRLVASTHARVSRPARTHRRSFRVPPGRAMRSSNPTVRSTQSSTPTTSSSQARRSRLTTRSRLSSQAPASSAATAGTPASRRSSGATAHRISCSRCVTEATPGRPTTCSRLPSRSTSRATRR